MRLRAEKYARKGPKRCDTLPYLGIIIIWGVFFTWAVLRQLGLARRGHCRDPVIHRGDPDPVPRRIRGGTAGPEQVLAGEVGMACVNPGPVIAAFRAGFGLEVDHKLGVGDVDKDLQQPDGWSMCQLASYNIGYVQYKIDGFNSRIPCFHICDDLKEKNEGKNKENHHNGS